MLVMLRMTVLTCVQVLSSKSKAHTVIGTPCYISPELCEVR